MTDHDLADLEAALAASGAADVPAVDADFAATLEQRLRSMPVEPAEPVGPGERAARLGDRGVARGGRLAARRLGTAGIPAGVAVLVVGGLAAAAGVAGVVAVRVAQRDDPSTTTVPVTTVATTVVDPSVGGAAVPSEPSLVVTTTTVTPTVTTAVTTVVTTVSPTTVEPSTEAPTSVPPATTIATTAAPATSVASPPAPTTTDGTVAVVMTLTCAGEGTTVSCSWTPGPAGTTQYLVLRSTPGGAQGRAFPVDVGTTTWSDPLPAAGTSFTYLVLARAGDTTLGRSEPVSITCC
ncbi:MAG: hypothetical protein U0Q03_16250 [Acidimicrobiales bacterium]